MEIIDGDGDDHLGWMGGEGGWGGLIITYGSLKVQLIIIAGPRGNLIICKPEQSLMYIISCVLLKVTWEIVERRPFPSGYPIAASELGLGNLYRM